MFSEYRKVSIFFHFIGKKFLKIFKFFNVDITTINLESVVTLSNDYIIPQKNVTVERHTFLRVCSLQMKVSVNT